MRFRRLLLAALALGLTVAPADAAVTISFYAHQLGGKGLWVEFPHAYVTLVGTPDAGGAAVKANFGFTPPVVGPSILFGRVDGAVVAVDDDYIAKDRPYFSFPLTDAQYAAVLAVVERWRNDKQPSYDLDTHNCVIFVKEVAAAVGLTTSADDPFVRDPAKFMADLKSRNQTFLAGIARRLAHTAPAAKTSVAAQ
ncbi:MAG: hypothetical protein WDN01_08915 [Rhizomicrobium sp.]